MNNAPELLVPAGTMEKLAFALAYGADAVYVGIKGLSLRAGAGNFDPDELLETVDKAHSAGARVYAAVNIFARDHDVERVEKILPKLRSSGVDALIVADPGILATVKAVWPDCRIHISTQANVLNSAAAVFWGQQGAARVTLARELSLNQISAISLAAGCETEVFVHGAMCIGYAGRCYLSKYMTGRDSNMGDCAHACRWKYHLLEEKRPGIYYPVDTDGDYYFYNSKDLCLARRLPEVIAAGVSSLKIEGRMKSLHYLATVTGVYRRLVDEIGKQGSSYTPGEDILAELRKVSHRGYTEGFIDGDWQESESPKTAGYRRDYDFVGVVETAATPGKPAVLGVRNQLRVGDEIEIVRPRAPVLQLTMPAMSRDDVQVDEAHANTKVWTALPHDVPPLSLLRRRVRVAAASATAGRTD